MATKPTSMQSLRKFAMKLPDTEEGVACEGTALESRTVKAGKKAFLFLRPTEARLKLQQSLPEATARASKEPQRYVVGSGGWVQVKFDDKTDPLDVLQRWVSESHALYAPKASKPSRSAGRARKAK